MKLLLSFVLGVSAVNVKGHLRHDTGRLQSEFPFYHTSEDREIQTPKTIGVLFFF